MQAFFFILYSLIGLALVITLINVWFAPRLQQGGRPELFPLVSVLIPARNEGRNIDACLQSLLAQDYPHLEIHVLDDFSEDDTAIRVRRRQESDTRLYLHTGKPLPGGWSGKNWACRQLGEKACGEILLFADADTRHHRLAVANSVAWMQRRNLGLLSAFSQQIALTPAERLVLPVIDMFLFCTLPLWLIYYSRSPAMAAASGQWMVFTRQAYLQIGTHQAVKNQVVEDVELARLAKHKGIPMLAVSGVQRVYCRMYYSAREVWDGFTKNIFGILGYNTRLFFTVQAVLILCCIVPYLLLAFAEFRQGALLAVAGNILVRLLLALRLKHHFPVALLLHPLGIALTVIIAFNSWLQVKKGSIRWKARRIDITFR